MKHLEFAAIVILGVLSCTRTLNEPVQIEEPAPVKTVTLTTTIGFGDDEEGESKALTALGVKTFAPGDRVAVVYRGSGLAGTDKKKAVSEALKEEDIYDNGKKARITVTLDSPYPYTEIRLIYPASMVKEELGEWSPHYILDGATINFAALKTQDGTLSSLASNLDLCVYDGELDNGQLPSSITLANRLVICEFNVLLNGGTVNWNDHVTNMTISNWSNTYTISRSESSGPIYVAMSHVIDGNIVISVNDGLLSKTISGKTLDAGKMYPINLKLQGVDLSKLTTSYEAKHGDALIGTLGEEVGISIADGATVTLVNISINASNGWISPRPGIKCNGDASLVLVGNNTVKGYHQNYPGIYPGPTGKALTIWGSGSLTVSGGTSAPGIGSSNDDANLDSCGDIFITSSPTISATGVPYAIGPGTGGTCGTITIGGNNVGPQASPFNYPSL